MFLIFFMILILILSIIGALKIGSINTQEEKTIQEDYKITLNSFLTTKKFDASYFSNAEEEYFFSFLDLISLDSSVNENNKIFDETFAGKKFFISFLPFYNFKLKQYTEEFKFIYQEDIKKKEFFFIRNKKCLKYDVNGGVFSFSFPYYFYKENVLDKNFFSFSNIAAYTSFKNDDVVNSKVFCFFE